jgi:ribosomal protein S3
MTRRSTRLMRLENSLYNYNNRKESWDVKEVNQKSNLNNENLFEAGSFFTSKHMSQKVNPISFRLNNNKTWVSTWFTNYKYFGVNTGKFQIDLYIREYIESTLKQLNILVDKIYIKEINNKFIIKIFVYEQGISNKKDIIIDAKRSFRFNKYFKESQKLILNPFFRENQKNSTKTWFIDPIKVIKHLEDNLNKYFKLPFFLSLSFNKDIGNSASLLGKFLCTELEKPNMSFKRALKDSLNQIQSKSNIRGLRVNCSGRLGRAPMAKMEWFKYGSIPLTKISANIDYVQLRGKTKYGSFGLKVWLYKL